MDQNIKPGNSNRITREYFDSLLIEMRHVDAVIPDTRLNLYGETFASPVMIAALSHLERYHPEGLAEMARGAKAAEAVMWAGMGNEEELDRIIATGAKTIKIIKPYADNDIIFRKIAHAEKCGCIAVGMDIDHAYDRNGEYDVTLGFHMSGKTLNEIREFVKSTRLPFIMKGVLSLKDAVLYAGAGVQGVVISHHHGIMDYAVPPLYVLPEIVREIGGKMPIFVDCCVESGYDVFKALALGATAVSVGRAMMGQLSENGADGVRDRVLEITAQLKGVMAKTCSPDISNIDSSVIRNAFIR